MLKFFSGVLEKYRMGKILNSNGYVS